MDCNQCGETLMGANDDELTRQLSRHMKDEHSEKLDADEAAAMVEEQAYSATDS
jgi:predicted small metal-binding protein